MSPVSHLSLLAFASAAVATPYASGYGHGHGHGHAHGHKALSTGSGIPVAYPTANVTAPHGSSCASKHGQKGGASGLPGSSPSPSVYQAQPSSSNAVPVKAVDNSQCPAQVTVTNTEKVYVTVTAGQPTSSAETSPAAYTSAAQKAGPPAYGAGNSEAAPAPSPSSAAPSAPVYSAPVYSSISTSTSVAAPAPAPSSAYSAPAPPPAPSSAESSPSSAGWVVPTSIPIPNIIPSAATSSAPAPSASAPSGGKRGLLYNQASLTDCFSGAKDISWGSNWLATSGGLSGFSFIPTLHSTAGDFTGSWSKDAQSAIDGGAKTLFSFNEPDIASQANMSPGEAAAGYVQYMNPFAGKATLCSPAVSSSENEGQGLSYLKEFVDACNALSEPCHIDALAVHWYGDATQADLFKQHIDATVQFAKDNGLGENTPIWVNEFGCSSGSDEQISSFLEDVMSYMDNHSSVAGYAYFYAENGYLVQGTEPSAYGHTYMSYNA